MNRPPDSAFDQRLADWLEDDPSLAPREVLGTVLAAYPSIDQRRASRVPWRFPLMNRYLLPMAAALIVVIGAALLVMRPASTIGPTGPTPSPKPSPTSAAVGTVAPTIELPPARPLAPAAVIDLAGLVKDTIPLTTDGKDVWVGVDGAVIHIDGQTNATRRIAVADMASGNGEIAITPEGLWIEDYRGNRIERVDPATGAVQLTVDVSLPRTIWFVDGELWIGTSGASGAYRVDRVTGALGERIGTTNAFSIGLGDVWVGGQSTDKITRFDAATGAMTGTIDVPAGTGCGVSGSFPDSVWAACRPDFGTCPPGSTAVRIDPATNRVVATALICGGPVAVVGGTPWFIAGRSNGDKLANSLISVDPITGRLLTQLDLGELDWDIVQVTDTAIWISDEQGDRVLRYDFTELHP